MTKEQQLMKGYAIQKRAGKIIFPVVVEHKHDEIRAHLKIRCSPDGSELLWDVVSYAGKPLANCHHMFEDLAKVAYIIVSDVGLMASFSSSGVSPP